MFRELLLTATRSSPVGQARGVGSAPMLGRIHLSKLKVGGSFYDCSFDIMESGPPMILGALLFAFCCCLWGSFRSRAAVCTPAADLCVPVLLRSGLDMLKRFQACINLKDNVLTFSKGFGEIETIPFLSEGQLGEGGWKDGAAQVSFAPPRAAAQYSTARLLMSSD